MNGSSVTLDKVSIQIEASAKQASGNIEELTRTLSELRSAVKGGFNNLSKLAASLEELKSASKNLGELEQNLSSLSNVQNALQSLGTIANPRGLDKTIKNLEKLPSVFNNMNPSAVSNIARVSNELSNALSPLASKMAQIGAGYSAMAQMASKYNVKVGESVRLVGTSSNGLRMHSRLLDTIKNGYKSVQKQNESFFKSLSKNASSVISKVKQIGLSLLGTRTIFTATRKAVSEYMAMDADLTWKVTNNWRALGAQLAPLIENVTWLFKQFVRVIYSVILALTGIDLIARANEKAMKGWGKAAKDTLGNLQKFDDLNVVEFPKSSGGDDNKLIDLDTIDLTPIQKIIDWVRRLRDEIKEAWSSGEWEGVGKVLAQGMNGAIKSVNFDLIEKKFKNIATKFGDFLRGVVNDFDWEVFGSQLTRQLSLIPRVLTMFINEVPWGDIGKGVQKGLENFDIGFIIDSVGNVIKALVGGISDFVTQIDGETLGKRIGEGVISIFRNIREILDAIDWGELGKKIRETILGIDWGEVFTQILSVFAKALSGIGEMIRGLFGAETSKDDSKNIAVGLGLVSLIVIIPKVVGLFSKLSKAKKELVSGTSFTEFFTELGEGLNHLMTLGGVALVLSSFALVLESVTHLLETFAKTGLSVGEVVGIMLAVFVPIVALMTAIKLLGPGMTAGLIPFSIVMLEIAGILAVMALTLPVILDAVADFIERVVPKLNSVLDTIGNNIQKIIQQLGVSLPPIIYTIGMLFDKIFSGIAKVVNSVGDVIVRVLDAVGRLVDSVFTSILNFIRQLGPAVNILVDNLITATTKLINFMVSGVEFMINGIIDAINGLSAGLRKIGNKLFELIGVDVKFNPISRVSLNRFYPKLQTGTNNIPEDGPYYLHANEAVVPKKYNPALGGGTNEETNKRLDTLIDIFSNLETTTIVNVGNDRLYKQQQRYVRRQNDKYGTDVNL